tara:strand:+ start:1560 stop:2789 length:1230 start_codon:yes stop_codon:yes gene_type:complete
MLKLKDLIKEFTGTTVGYGLNTGDAWPDGIFTKYGETRLITPAGMPRGMKQLVAPAADSVYGGDGSKREKTAMEKHGVLKRTKITPEYVKSNAVIDPHELRDDTPPLAPKQRVFGRRPFGTKPDYIIPREAANFVTTDKNLLVKPTTPPEGSKSGGIPATPEPGSTSKSGYRQLQKGGENMVQGKGIDKMYIYKMLGHYDPKREGLTEHILRVLLEAGSLPLKLKKVKKHSNKKISRQSDGGVSDDFFNHHKYHSGAHLTGKGAEHATYDFDDSDYDVEGGYQNRKDNQKRGYEPVENLTKEQIQTITDNLCVNCGLPANENLRKWFKDKWVNIGKKKKGGGHPPCGSSGKKRGYAKCVPKSKAANMSKKQKASATRRKRAAQNKAGRGGKQSAGQGKKPIYVSTKPKK